VLRRWWLLLSQPVSFAVSMAFNYLGMPVGAALAGLLADRSVEAAILVLGIGGSILAAVVAAVLIPGHEPAAVPPPA